MPHFRRFLVTGVLVLLVGLFLWVFRTSVWADYAAGAGRSATAVNPVIPYQARLLDPASGNPKPDGVYTLTFRLYHSASGGSPLWTETKDVTVSNGLFATLLGDTTPLPAGLFDGSALWLGVKVGSDPETTPRMRLGFAPYAVWAANADTVDGLDAAALAPADHEHDAAYVNDNAGEVDNADVADGALAPEKISGVAWTGANMGTGSGLDADTLDGNDSADFAPATHDHDDRYVGKTGVQTISATDFDPVLYVTQEGSGSAIIGSTQSNLQGRAGVVGMAGDPGLTIIGKYGVLGQSDTGKGVVGVSKEDSGVYGWTTDGPAAVRAEASNGYGLYAYSSSKEAIYAVGDVAARSYKYNTPRQHILTIPGEAFHPGSDVPYFNSYGNGGAYIESGTGALVAPVYLPEGATITRFTAYVDDRSSADVTVYLRSLFMTGSYQTHASVSSSGSSGNQSLTDTTISSPTVDYDGRGYLIYAYSSGWNSNLQVMGVTITYTLSEAP